MGWSRKWLQAGPAQQPAGISMSLPPVLLCKSVLFPPASNSHNAQQATSKSAKITWILLAYIERALPRPFSLCSIVLHTISSGLHCMTAEKVRLCVAEPCSAYLHFNRQKVAWKGVKGIACSQHSTGSMHQVAQRAGILLAC